MEKAMADRLGRRECAIMDAVYALGSATPGEAVEFIGEPEAYDSIRVVLANLSRKGVLRRRRDGRSYTYFPVVPSEAARRPAMRRLIDTHFAGCACSAALAFLDMSRDELSPEGLEQLSEWIAENRCSNGSVDANPDAVPTEAVLTAAAG